MREVTANIWNSPDADAICITTNGFVKQNGACVMGAGVAKQCRDKYPGCDKSLGSLIQQHGNVTQQFWYDPGHYAIVAFPVKHHWRQQADPMLIIRSANQLLDLTNKHGWSKVGLVRPGCGNGGLQWNKVKPLLSMLDDRFWIVEK